MDPRVRMRAPATWIPSRSSRCLPAAVLPVELPASPALSRASRRWSAVTIQVAWTLLRDGIRPTGQTLTDAREHVLGSLPDSVPDDWVDPLAAQLTRDFLERARTGRYRLRPLPSAGVPASAGWRRDLLTVLDPIGEIVFRLVYGDGLSLEEVEHRRGIDRVILAGSQEGLRSAVRALLRGHGVAHTSWDTAWVDSVLVRLSEVPSEGCQGGVELAAPGGRSHAEHCPRCGRGLRLIRGGLLSPGELVPPADGPAPPAQVQVLALHLHPEARHCRGELIEAFGACALRADEDALFIDLTRATSPQLVLTHQAELGRPKREHLRGARLRGAGRFTAHGLIGPVATDGLEATRSRSWGEVDGVGPLPEPLPEPPPVARWWMAAALAVMLALLAGMVAWRTGGPEPVHPLTVAFQQGGGEVLARFDTSDRAHLLVVVRQGQELAVLFSSTRPADKGELGTGEGDYEVHVPGDQLLLASGAKPFTTLEPVLMAVSTEADPLGALSRRLRAVQPRADVEVQGQGLGAGL